MPKKPNQTTDEKFDTIIGLLQHLLALELAKGGVKRGKIAKHLRIATATVVKLLEGVKKEK